MIRSDNHVHTYFSSDSEEKLTDMLEEAVRQGFSSICLTDHMDYNFPVVEIDMDYTFDVDTYLQEIQDARERFPMLEIRQGVELGLRPSVLEKCLQLAQNYPFDFIIGSTHLVEDMDPYFDILWEKYEEADAIRRYYEATLANVSLPFPYDVYGHLDYILRYSPSMKRLKANSENTDNYLERQCKQYEDIIDEILHKILENGHGIEINTAGLKYGMGHTNPHERILSRYREIGGEIITVGSDAHARIHLGYQFPYAESLLKSLGFRYYTEFKHRKPVMIPL